MYDVASNHEYLQPTKQLASVASADRTVYFWNVWTDETTWKLCPIEKREFAPGVLDELEHHKLFRRMQRVLT